MATPSQVPKTMRSNKASLLAACAAGMFLFGTAIALFQYTRPYYWHEPNRSWSWFWRPLEWNIDSALPDVPRNIHAIAQSMNGSCLWIAGQNAFLAYSADHGRTWNELQYTIHPDGSATFDAPKSPSFPCAGSPPQITEIRWPSLVPSAEAAATQSAAGGRQTSGNQINQSQVQSPQQTSKSSSASANSGEQNSAIQQKQSPRQGSNGTGTVNAEQQNSAPQQQNQATDREGTSSPLLFEPNILVFGTVEVGKKSVRPLTIRNLTDNIILLRLPVVNGGGPTSREPKAPFALDSSVWKCDKIGPYESCTEYFMYAPTVPTGSSSESWTLTLSPAGGAPYRIPLEGTAVLANISDRPSKNNENGNQGKPPTQPPSKPDQIGNDGNNKNPPPLPMQAPISPDIWSISQNGYSSGSLLLSDLSTFTTDNYGESWLWNPRTTNARGLGDKYLDNKRYIIDERVIPTQFERSLRITGASLLPNQTPAGSYLLWDDPTRSLRLGRPGISEERYSSNLPPDAHIDAMHFISTQGWALDLGTRIELSNDEGKHWTEISRLRAPAHSLFANANGRDLWVAGDQGLLLHSPDGGHAWLPLTRRAAAAIPGHDKLDAISSPAYGRFLAPWYLAALVLCVFFLRVAFREQSREKEKTPPPSASDVIIGSQGLSDKPLEPWDPDALELGKIASGLSFFLRNEKTKPPLVIGINGRWGSGKSSLMNLLMKNLETVGACPVWFNAWHHQKEEQLLAALLQAIKQQAVPKWAAWSGIHFRWNLFRTRLQRSWPYVGGVGALWFLIWKAEVFLRTSITPPITIWRLLHNLLNVDLTDATNTGPLSWIAGLAALYHLLSKLLTAFGSSPEALLTSVAGSGRKKELEAQTSFRARFAREFKEVTTALPANQRMLMLIDDLDRCRPEKVREIFEGINFLVSSGDCFVVLGMAREMVEHYLGLSFRKIVDGLSWEALGLNEEDRKRAEEELAAAPSKTQASGQRRNDDQQAIARRYAFARLYLDKLVQIEVNVPQPTAEQRRVLFENPDPKQNSDTQEQKLQTTLRRFRIVANLLNPILQATLAAIVIVGLGYGAGVFGKLGQKIKTSNDQILKGAKDKKDAADLEAKQKESTVESLQRIATGLSQIAAGIPSAGTAPSHQGTPSKTGNQPQQPGDGANTLGSTAAQSANQQSAPALTGPLSAGRLSMQQGWTGSWPFVLVSFAAAAAFPVLLRNVPEQNVQDSAEFARMLTIWSPLVMTAGTKNTPRTAKRFQNRVRYLAMRQRALSLGEPLSFGERWLREWKGVPQPQPERLIHLKEPLNLLQQMEVEQARELATYGGKTKSWMLTPGAVPKKEDHSYPLDPQEFAACIRGRVVIPESLLVAFAAVEEFRPSWIHNLEDFQLIFNVGHDGEKGSDKTVATENLLNEEKYSKKAVDLLRRCQKASSSVNYQNLLVYRYAFLQLGSELSPDPAPRPAGLAVPPDQSRARTTSASG